MIGKFLSGFAAAALLIGAGAAHGWDAAEEEEARQAIAAFKQADSGIENFFNEAYGYAVFPEITKGAVGIGGAGGDGIVFERGAGVGSSSVSQVTIGLQLGGQTYRQAIFFKDKAALDAFKQGNFEVAAGTSAVAVKEGVSKTIGYEKGVAIVTMAKGGLMFEASVGGQKFTYEPR
jgi:lipid-binding SYLF domain-containing protein